MAPKAPKKRKDDGQPELSLECAHPERLLLNLAR